MGYNKVYAVFDRSRWGITGRSRFSLLFKSEEIYGDLVEQADVTDDRSNLANRTRVRAWCPQCGDRLYNVYYINPKSSAQHVAKTNFLVCRACPRFFALSITELPLQILPREDRRRMGVFRFQSREEIARIQGMGMERARGPRDGKGRFLEVQALTE